MYFEKTLRFKTRRKSQALLVSLFMLGFISASLAAVHQTCPHHCECFLLDNMKTASCDRLVWNGTYFPSVRQLQMIPASDTDPCRIFNFTSKMFPNLVKLDLSNCSLTTVPAPGANSFQQLHTIDLSHNHLINMISGVFLTYPKLQYLNLANNPINPHSLFALESTTLYDLNLASCHISTVPMNMFAGVPNLKYLSLSNNTISVIYKYSLPDGLRTLDLSKNKIIEIPTGELLRLKQLRQINFYGDPINCTCGLMGFQDWVNGKGVIFVTEIVCGHPSRYAGRKLNSISHYELCDFQIILESRTERCAPNQICNTGGAVSEEGYTNDENKDALEKDEVIPVDKDSPVIEDNSMMLDGSGDGDGTDSPKETTKKSHPPSSTVSTSSTSEEGSSQSPSPSAESARGSSDGVVKVEHELTSTLENVTNPPLPETNASTTRPDVYFVPDEGETTTSLSAGSTVSLMESTSHNDTMQLTSEIETLAPEGNATHVQLQERLQHESGHREVYGYLIPGLALLLIGLVCLAVYCSQCASKVETYKPPEADIEGRELQEVSLLPDKAQPSILKHTNKYPGELESGQTERLMSEHELNGRNNVAEVNGNGSQHSDDTLDCCSKLANGQSMDQNVECTVVKVTTLPDSVPQTALLRNI